MTAKYRLMVPGPTTAAPEVLAAGALPVIDERIPRFAALFHRTLDNLRQMFGTGADVLVFASSMTGAFESVVQNTCSPGDKILVVNNGHFAQRWVDLGRAYGLDVVDLRHEWGSPADPDRVAAALAADPAITAAVCVHCETSTGAMSDLRAFGAVTRDVLSIVDTASSLGAGELRLDDWGIDVAIGGGQKALGIPAGLGFVTVGERAWRAHRTARLPRFYFDWTAAHSALTERGATPWTPAVSLITQLDIALQGLIEEGLGEVWRRHALMGAAARAGLTALDLRLTVAPEHASPAVTGVWMPDGVDSRPVVARMLDEHGIQITGGLGPQTGRVARIGHCGHADGLDVVMTLAALERTLAACGYDVKFGAGVAAAQEALHTPALHTPALHTPVAPA